MSKSQGFGRHSCLFRRYIRDTALVDLTGKNQLDSFRVFGEDLTLLDARAATAHNFASTVCENKAFVTRSKGL